MKLSIVIAALFASAAFLLIEAHAHTNWAKSNAMQAKAAVPGDINLTGYTLTFDDEFNTKSITTASPKGASTWFYWPPYGAAGAYSASTWDVNSFSLNNGILSDKAFLDASKNWHSGNISSMDPTGAGFSQQWGYFEARVQMPNSATGAWPAFWLAQKGGIPAVKTGLPGEELDIFEWYGVSHNNIPGMVQQASHNWNVDGSQDPTPSLYSPQTKIPDGSQPWTGYHIYGLQVDPVHITWYIDGVQTNQIATPMSHMTSPFYIMLDYGLGGGWPLTGMVNNSSFNIDWVRVWALPRL
jgi:beta-glucanase (GH16 family)